MKIIKSFSVFKARESENEKAPTHKLSAKIGDEYVEIGSAWTKATAKGDKFLSAQLAKAWVDHTDNTKSRKAIVICFEEDLIELHKKAGEDYVDEATIPSIKPKTAPQSDLNEF